jgi:putative salt-induced outer membrane protein
MILPFSVNAEVRRPWQSEVEFGLVTTRGNTDTDNLNAKAKVVNERAVWRHTGRVEAVNSATDGVRSAERYFALVKSDRKLSELSYLFATANYDDDRFSGYDYRASAAVGYGRSIIKRDRLAYDLEAGAGARQSKLTGGSGADNEGIVLGAMRLDWQFSDSAAFGEDLTVEAGENATITRSISSLKSTLTSSIALKITVTVKHTSDVPAPIKNTDVETATTMVYTF